MSIFTITLISSENEEKIVAEDKSRCIGYYLSLQESIDAVKSNKGEMHECLYNYLVIEEVPVGVWRLSVNEWWYAWSSGWITCKKPFKYRKFANVSGFSMG